MVTRAASTPAAVSNTASVTSFTLSAPTGTVDGDLLVALVNSNGADSNSVPSGWNLVSVLGPNSGSCATVLMWFYWTTGSPTSWTVNLNQSTPYGCVCVGYAGASATAPIGATQTHVAAGAESPCTVSAITTTRAGSMGVGLIGISSNSTTFSAYPTSYSSWAETGGKRVDVADRSYSTAGTSTGSLSWTPSATVASCIFNVEILPPAPSAFQQKQLNDGASYLWALTEAHGTTAGDVADGNNSAYVNCTLNQAGPSRTGDAAASLNGTTSYISSAHGPNVSGTIAMPTNDFSVELWFTSGAVGSSALGGIFMNSVDQVPTALAQSVTFTIYIGTDNQLYWVLWKGSNVSLVATGITVTDNNWHHVVVTQSSTAGMVLYLDGSPVASNAGSTAAVTALTGYWCLGWGGAGGFPNVPGASGHQVNWLAGKLSDVAVYNTTVLSAAQVAAHYTSSIAAADLSYYYSGGGSNSTPASSIGGARSSAKVTSGGSNHVWGDVTSGQATSGLTSYICVYVENDTGTSNVWTSVRAWIDDTPTVGSVAIGLDPVGINGTATTLRASDGLAITDNTQAPQGVSFSSPTDYPHGLPIGNLNPTDKQAIWLRRTIPPGASAGPDTISIRCDGFTP